MSHEDRGEPEEDWRERRAKRMRRMQKLFDESFAEEFEDRPLPWTASLIIHDGPGFQFFDSAGKPVLSEPIREPEDASWLLRFVNRFMS